MSTNQSGDLYLELDYQKIRSFTDDELWLLAVSMNSEIAAMCNFTSKERMQFGSWITTFAYVTFENFRTYTNPHFLGGEMILARKILKKMIPAHPEIATAYEESLIHTIEFGQKEFGK